MDTPGWLTSRREDVPAGTDWLGKCERRALARFRVAPRRSDWLLGRWTAKTAVASWLSVAPARIEVLAAPDGAPEAYLDGRPAPLSVSLSHRAGRAIAVVADAPVVVGCDLEVVEHRSDAFVRTWLGAAEQRLVSGGAETERDMIANLIWTAKEAAAKVRREGLRLDLRRAVVRVGGSFAEFERWHEMRVEWTDEGGGVIGGWWRSEPGWVIAIAGDPAPEPPRMLPAQWPSSAMSRSA
jgi:4'-phosphopantetheinyl transferase